MHKISTVHLGYKYIGFLCSTDLGSAHQQRPLSPGRMEPHYSKCTNCEQESQGRCLQLQNITCNLSFHSESAQLLVRRNNWITKTYKQMWLLSSDPRDTEKERDCAQISQHFTHPYAYRVKFSDIPFQVLRHVHHLADDVFQFLGARGNRAYEGMGKTERKELVNPGCRTLFVQSERKLK